MQIHKIEKVKQEIQRLKDAIRKLEEVNPGPTTMSNGWLYGPRETGAVRRASMDVTRALADLRRPN